MWKFLPNEIPKFSNVFENCTFSTIFCYGISNDPNNQTIFKLKIQLMTFRFSDKYPYLLHWSLLESAKRREDQEYQKEKSWTND
jgi:hypothetical protein